MVKLVEEASMDEDTPDVKIVQKRLKSAKFGTQKEMESYLRKRGIAVFFKRDKEPTISYENLLKKLKADGKI